MNTPKQYLGIAVRGFCMGIADLIPGVSGGTIAFISGIYQRLISAISAFSNVALWQDICKLNIRTAWHRADANFLIALFAGILAAVFLLSGVLHYLLQSHAHLLLGFFCGLVIASSIIITKKIETFLPRHIFIGISGIIIAAIIVNIPEFSLSATALTLPIFFIGGAIAICAMILPGISGSYLLLLAGLYAPVINALHERQWLIIIVFAAGCGVGLLCFARLLSIMLRKWHDGMMIFLSGVMLGALPKLWPWKEQGADIKTIMQPNLSIGEYAKNYGEAQLFFVIVLLVIGVAIPFTIDYAQRQIRSQQTGENTH